MRGWKAISFKQYSELCKFRQAIHFEKGFCSNDGTYSGCECCATFCRQWRKLGRADIKVIKISIPNISRPNKQSDSLKIGDYEISQSHLNDDKVWIAHKSGEGSEFDKNHLGKAIGKYYEENF